MLTLLQSLFIAAAANSVFQCSDKIKFYKIVGVEWLIAKANHTLHWVVCWVSLNNQPLWVHKILKDFINSSMFEHCLKIHTENVLLLSIMHYYFIISAIPAKHKSNIM